MYTFYTFVLYKYTKFLRQKEKHSDQCSRRDYQDHVQCYRPLLTFTLSAISARQPLGWGWGWGAE